VEDVNLPFAVRGPGIPQGKISDIPQTHVDIAPTILDIAGLPREEWPPFFDGRSLLPEWKSAVDDPLPDDDIEREVINVEYWGSSTAPAGKYTTHWRENSYKSLRLVAQNGKQGWLFNRWCTLDQTELYDTVADPYELRNLALDPDEEARRIMSRLSGLLLVTKSCGRDSCRIPWEVLSEAYKNGDTRDVRPMDGGQDPIGGTAFRSLDQAMDHKFDKFFASLPVFSFNMCLPYQLPSNEGPFFPASSEDLGRKYRQSTEDYSYYRTESSLPMDTMSTFGDEQQRYSDIDDLYRDARVLTEMEMGWVTELCQAPDYCNQIEEED
jgi:N-acetylglucosamine-6-sulfatase